MLWWIAAATASTEWTEYLAEPVRIECATVDGEPWCRAHGHTDLPLAAVAAAVEDRTSFPKYFPHVSEVKLLDVRTFYMRIDLPAPISDRIQVTSADRIDEGEVRIYRWQSVTHPDAPQPSGVVLLDGAAGEWRLEPDPAGGTKLRYSWQGEMGGGFPSWALGRAWVAHGKETISGTLEAAKNHVDAELPAGVPKDYADR